MLENSSLKFRSFFSKDTIIITIITLLLIFFNFSLGFIKSEFTNTLVISLIVFISLGIFISKALIKKKFILAKSRILYSIILLLIAFLLSGIFANYSSESLFGIIFESRTFSFFLTVSLLTLFTSLFINTRNRIFTLLYTLLFSFLLLLILFILNIFGIGILTGFLISSYITFIYLTVILSLLSITFLDFTSVRKNIKTLLIISFIISLLLLILTNIYSIWIIISMVSFLFILYAFLPLSPKNKILPVFAIILFLVSVTFLSFSNSLSSINSKINLPVEYPISLKTDFSIIKDSWKGVPLVFGTGGNSFAKDWVAVRGKTDMVTKFSDLQRGNSFVSTSIVETGVLGLFSWLVFYLILLSSILVSMMRKYKDEKSWLLSTIISIINLFIWLSLLIFYPNTIVIILAFVFLGIFIALQLEYKFIARKIFSFERESRNKIISIIFISILSIILVVGVYLFARRSVSLLQFNNGISLLQTDINKSIEKLNNAMKLSYNDDYARFMSNVYLNQLISYLSETEKISKDNNSVKLILENAVLHAQNSIVLDSKDIQNWISLANIYHSISDLGIEGAYENARVVYKDMYQAFPYELAPYLIQSRLELRENDEENLDIFLTLLDERQILIPSVYLIAAQIKLNDKENEEAINRLNAGLQVFPRDYSIASQLGNLLFINEKYQEAVDVLFYTVNLQDKNVQDYYLLAMAFEKIGNLDQAVQTLEFLKSILPDEEKIDIDIARIKEAMTKSILNPEENIEEFVEEESNKEELEIISEDDDLISEIEEV